MLKKKNFIKIWLLTAGIVLSILLEFIAIRSYHQAIPVAEENLRGIALSISSAIESMAMKDTSLKLLENLISPDIAFFSVMDKKGVQKFHSNPDLIGTIAENITPDSSLFSNGFSENRIILGTGEEAYEFLYPLHIPDSPLLLRLVLHAYRSDSIVRRAKIEMAVILSMLLLGWILGLFIYSMALKAEKHRKAMEEKENLARLGTMGAVLAHEIRNPLAGIKGYAQLLSERLKKEEEILFSDLIVKEAIRLESLVNGLLEYVRNEKTEGHPFSINDTVDHALSLIEKDANDSCVKIEKKMEENLMALGNKNKYLQVLLNIFRNAVQAMPEGGTLEIKTTPSKNHQTEIMISDTGPGIDENLHEKIFEPFFTTKARGSGFGLSVSKKYMEEMKGSISLDPKQEQGSVFRLILQTTTKDNQVL